MGKGWEGVNPSRVTRLLRSIPPMAQVAERAVCGRSMTEPEAGSGMASHQMIAGELGRLTPTQTLPHRGGGPS
jgi:hypothetical protein